MARIIHYESGPISPDPSEESRNDDATTSYELEIIDWIEGERYDEIIVQFPMQRKSWGSWALSNIPIKSGSIAGEKLERLATS